MKIVAVAGTRPNFIKIASLMREFRRRERVQSVLVHTGQHYDRQMSEAFFDDLEIPRPDIELGIGSGSHAVQTGQILIKMEDVLLRERPDVLVVVGDVNSTIAAAMAASKLQIPVAHVESGLRSHDRSMPEEINRLLTDAISDHLFTTEESGNANLRREGVPEEKIHFVGNVMIDTLVLHRQKAARSDILVKLGLQAGPKEKPRRYGVLTLHRPSNVDDPRVLGGILGAVGKISAGLPIVFPCHPRTQKLLKASPPAGVVLDGGDRAGIRMLEPLGYLEFLRLTSEAAVVLTDSGGIQEETTVLGVPCLTLRNNTERPVTITEGTNRLVGPDPAKILAAYDAIEKGPPPVARVPPLWDGKAAGRIADILERVYRG